MGLYRVIVNVVESAAYKESIVMNEKKYVKITLRLLLFMSRSSDEMFIIAE